MGDFWGQNTEASPYQTGKQFSLCLAPSLLKLTGSPFVGFLQLSFSHAEPFQLASELGQFGSSCCHKRKLPAPARLNDPDGTCTRIAQCFGSNPLGKILVSKTILVFYWCPNDTIVIPLRFQSTTCLDSHGLTTSSRLTPDKHGLKRAGKGSEVFHRRPHSKTFALGRIHGLLSLKQGVRITRKSPHRARTSHSRGIRLYGSNIGQNLPAWRQLVRLHPFTRLATELLRACSFHVSYRTLDP